jgi:hypothetical protein
MTDQTPRTLHGTELLDGLGRLAQSQLVEAARADFVASPQALFAGEAVAVLIDVIDQLTVTSNAATAMNGVHERTIARLRTDLEQAKLAPGPTGLARVWSGHDDNECWHPFFAEQADAKAYAEAAFRASCSDLETDDPGEITWKERQARTDKTGYPDMFDLQSEVGGDGWVLCGVLVHPDLASGLRAAPIETAEADDGPEPQIPGQGELPVEAVPAPRGYRVGDLVEITGRGDIFDGKTGVVAKVDDDPEYPMGLTVEGVASRVWCNSGEIRHADATAGSAS